VFPYRISRLASPEKKIRVNHGVLYVECSRENSCGSWRCSDSDHDSREIPIMPAFVAMKRIVAARIPTYHWAMCSTVPCRPEARDDPQHRVVLEEPAERRRIAGMRERFFELAL